MTTKILPGATGVLALADGTILQGIGVGAVGSALGEVVFNTAMTGYQEILTDPSYAAQIVTFTFPHIGNVGTNDEDVETVDLAQSAGAVGAIFGAPVTDPSNFRSQTHLANWLTKRGIIALSGVDTRALTTLIREKGMPNAVIAHAPDGKFDLAALSALAPGLPRTALSGSAKLSAPSRSALPSRIETMTWAPPENTGIGWPSVRSKRKRFTLSATCVTFATRTFISVLMVTGTVPPASARFRVPRHRCIRPGTRRGGESSGRAPAATARNANRCRDWWSRCR